MFNRVFIVVWLLWPQSWKTGISILYFVRAFHGLSQSVRFSVVLSVERGTALLFDFEWSNKFYVNILKSRVHCRWLYRNREENKGFFFLSSLRIHSPFPYNRFTRFFFSFIYFKGLSIYSHLYISIDSTGCVTNWVVMLFLFYSMSFFLVLEFFFLVICSLVLWGWIVHVCLINISFSSFLPCNGVWIAIGYQSVSDSTLHT